MTVPAHGDVPLTPTMRALAEQAGEVALTGGLFQSMTVRTPAGLDEERLARALAALTAHHPVLRARLVGDGEGRRLEVPAASEDVPGELTDLVRRVDVAGLGGPELERLIAEEGRAAGDQLDPVAGEMLRAVWFDAGPGEAGRLLLAAHHLVVDGVSWRVLLPDLAAADAALAVGAEPELDPVPVPFRHWALTLAEQAAGAAREAELADWEAVVAGAVPLLATRPLDPDRDLAVSMRRTQVAVPADVTAELLTSLPAALGAGTDEVLLTGLALAVTAWARRRGRHTGAGLLVDIEGHGREPLTPGMDLSRTVGWCTSVHPVRLHTGSVDLADVRAGGQSVARAVARTREQLREVPGDGLGYGLLRHLNPRTGPVLAALPVPEIAFNYLGRFTSGSSGTPPPGTPAGTSAGPVAGTPAASPFAPGLETPAGTPTAPLAAAQAPPADWQPAENGGLGGGADARMAATHVLEAAGLVADGPAGPELLLSLTWPGALLDTAAVAELADAWRDLLAGMAAHRTTPGGDAARVPADFALVTLAQHEIDELDALDFMDER
jgi:non-ribosomal peptide synthase protein (TIGR01720 family)